MSELQGAAPRWPSRYENGVYLPNPQQLLEFEVPKVQGVLHGAALQRFERQTREQEDFIRREFVVVSASFQEIGRAALSLMQTEYPNLPTQYEVTPSEERNRYTIYGDPKRGLPGFIHMPFDYQNLVVAMALDPRGGKVLPGELDNPVSPIVVARMGDGKVDLRVMPASGFRENGRPSRLLRSYDKEVIPLRTGEITPIENHPQYQVAVGALDEMARRLQQENYQPLPILPPHLSAAEAGIPPRPFPGEPVLSLAPAPWPAPPTAEPLRIGTSPETTSSYQSADTIDVRPLLGLPVPEETRIPGVVYQGDQPAIEQGWTEVTTDAALEEFIGKIKEDETAEDAVSASLDPPEDAEPSQPRRSHRRRSWRNWLRIFKRRKKAALKHRTTEELVNDEDFWANAKAQMDVDEPQETFAWSDQESQPSGTTTDEMKLALGPISGPHTQEAPSPIDDIRRNLAIFLAGMVPSGTQTLTARNMQKLADTIYVGIKKYIKAGDKDESIDNGVHPAALNAAAWLRDAVTFMGGSGKRGARKVLIEALGDFHMYRPPIEIASQGRLKLRRLSRREDQPQLIIEGGKLSDLAIQEFMDEERRRMLADR